MWAQKTRDEKEVPLTDLIITTSRNDGYAFSTLYHPSTLRRFVYTCWLTTTSG